VLQLIVQRLAKLLALGTDQPHPVNEHATSTL